MFAKISRWTKKIIKSFECRANKNIQILFENVSRYLATGESQTSLAIMFKCSQTSVHRIVCETTKVVAQVLKNKVFPKLNFEYFQNIAQGFEQQWNFPHCIGCIDGKHITIQVSF